MTIIEKIKAEIERRQEKAIESSKCTELNTAFYSGKAVALGSLLSFLSTLESEKPMNQNEELNEEIKRFVAEYGYERSEDILLTAFVARHFAKWGAERLASIGKTSPNDLEEAADEYSKKDEYMDVGFCVEPVYIGHKTEKAFIAGAKWQAEQLLKSSPMPEDTVLFNKGVEEGKRLMMEEAVEGRVWNDYMENFGYCLQINLGAIKGNEEIHDGDKVRIIIVKRRTEYGRFYITTNDIRGGKANP